MIICSCHGITDRDLRAALKADPQALAGFLNGAVGAGCPGDGGAVCSGCPAGTGCGCCRPTLQAVARQIAGDLLMAKPDRERGPVRRTG
jgi:bacterioferritin-associated ferredoxin